MSRAIWRTSVVRDFAKNAFDEKYGTLIVIWPNYLIRHLSGCGNYRKRTKIGRRRSL
jgi:hypothetical protein